MKRFLVISALGLSHILMQPAFAETRELSRNELRENVRLGKSLSFSSVVSAVARQFDAEIVDVRAFEADAVYYRVLIKGSDGKLNAVIMDAQTGQFMPSGSRAVVEVMAASKSTKGSSASNNGRGNSNPGGNSNAGGNGKGGGNGNAGGNSGGKGGGKK